MTSPAIFPIRSSSPEATSPPGARWLSVTSLADWDGAIQITENTQAGDGGHMFGDMLFAGTVGDGHDIELDNGLCGLLRIGYSLTGDLSIFGTPGLPNEGITGQVIINALNWSDNSEWGKWTGAVNIGPQGAVETLDPKPYYNNKAVDIGGGAVGRVPYYLHYNDCTPTATKVNENQTTGLDGYNPNQCVGIHIDEVLIPEEPLPSVTLHHYGPVLREGTGMPVTIHRRQMAAACAWETEDIAPNFTLVMHPGGNKREVRIDGPFAEGYYYLIEPKDENETDYLYCDDLDVSVVKVAVHDYDLVMRVRRIQDLTLNGLLQPDDITAWIANPQDTTLDGTTDNNDLVDVINAVAEYGE